MIRTIIIDDEQPAREILKVYLGRMHGIQLIGEAGNGFDGIKLVNSEKPDLILLDIQMPKINGFEMLELLEVNPKVIFCTAYDEFAIKAFDNKAIDYLLKPFTYERLVSAVEKVQVDKKQIQELRKHGKATYLPDQHLSRVVVKTNKSIDIIDVQKICFLEAQDDYVEINTGQAKWLKQQTMNYFENSLDEQQFVRVHRRFIINVVRIKKIDKLGKETYLALMDDSNTIPISKSGYQRLKEVLKL